MAKVTNQLAKVNLEFVKEWQSNKFGPERILLKTKIQKKKTKSKYDPRNTRNLHKERKTCSSSSSSFQIAYFLFHNKR
jgi:hypothetical protein